METTPNAGIAEKIKKLLALANGNTTEGEAELAMAKVQELLDKYNLSMAEVGALTKDKAQQGQDGGKRTRSVLEKCAMYEYQRKLMTYVADLYYCLHFVHDKYKPAVTGQKGRSVKYKVHHLIGREVNVISATLMFEYLNSTIERMAKERFPVPYNLSKSAISWKEGCADRLCLRLWNLKQETEAKSDEAVAQAKSVDPNSTLPAIRQVRSSEFDFNLDFIYGYEPGTYAAKRAERRNLPVVEEEVKETEAERIKREKKQKRYQEAYERKQQRIWDSKDHAAYYDGNEKGRDINLNRQINEGGK